MQVKKGSMIWLILDSLTALALLGLSIYQIFHNELDWINLLLLIVLISNIPQFIEFKK